jgi:hypothetical protein
MKKFNLLLIGIFFLTVAQAQQFTLVKNGKSNCRIIIPEMPNAVEVQAAKVFQDYIQRISGATLAIESDNFKPSDGEILIGNVNREEIKDVPSGKLQEDGLYIRNTGKKLVIAGGTDRGVLYGVYTFLEKYMGCRKYSSAVTYVPKQKTIVLHSINDLQIPSFAFREDHYRDAYDPEYQEWHKLDSHSGQGGNNGKWGTWVHTFGSLLSPKDYGESHPEYFSFYDGKRHPEFVPSFDGKGVQPESQLCLSNPDVLEIVCKSLEEQMKRNPDAVYWSVSQNDNVRYCRCPKCTEIDEKYAAFEPGTKLYGTHVNSKYSPIGSGSVITFVNKVAERFPDKIISTLAYQYTRVPPKDLIPGKNVNIMLCNIESARNVNIELGDESFSSDLAGWGKLTDNIIIWDYIIQFSNLISPFPNLLVLQPNIQFFQKNRVSALFEQGNREIGGEFAELRAYLIAKLLWDSNIDVNAVMDDFLSGYYGKASKDLREYIDLLHRNNMAGTDFKLSIFGSPVLAKENYLSESLIAEYNKIFDRAEKAVSDNPDVLLRVRSARMPVYYAMLQIAKDEKTGNRGAFINGGSNTQKPKPEITKILYDFSYQSIRTNVTRVTEWRTTPKEYLTNYLKFLQEPK